MSSRRISHVRAFLSSSTWSFRGQIPALSLALAAGVSTSAVAQSEGEAQYLGQIVITASGFEQLLKDAPASISVISGEELQKGDFSSLTDALKSVQGVAVTGVANESDIYIRGLPGAYTLILVDGKRQSTRDARTNGNSGFEQSFVPPVSAIDRIEVVRGPMSSLYGSDAMGGVINIITKKVSDVWAGEVGLETTIQEGSRHGDSVQGNFYLNGPIVAERLGLQLWGRAMNRDASREDVAGGRVASQERDINARLTWTPTDAQDVMLQWGKTEIERTNPNASPNSDNYRDHFSLSHVGRWDWGNSDISYQEEVGERVTYRDIAGSPANTRRPEITNKVLDAKFNMQLGAESQHNLTFGGQFFRAQLRDENPGLRDGIARKYTADQWALFVEDEWQLRDDFALTFGLRYNDHEEYKGHFSPRIYGVWSATDTLTVKGGVSTGFRAPDIRSITPGYAYTTGGGSCSTGSALNGFTPSCGVIVADPNLKPETSVSYEISVAYDQGPVQLSATAFHTQFDDKIENYNTGIPHYLTYPGAGTQPGNTGTFHYNTWLNRNVSKARISGLELTADWDINDVLSMSANYTYSRSKQQTGDFKGFPLARTPEHMASIRFDWMTPVEGLNAWAAGNYHGSEIFSSARGTSSTSPGTDVYINGKLGKKYKAYATVDVGASYDVSESVSANFAIYNLFDEQVVQEQNNTVLEGRRAWVSLTKRF